MSQHISGESEECTPSTSSGTTAYGEPMLPNKDGEPLGHPHGLSSYNSPAADTGIRHDLGSSPPPERKWFSMRELRQQKRKKLLANRPHDYQVQRRRAFHTIDRKKVCEMAEQNPSMTHQALATLFGTNKTTITRTLNERTKWLQSTQFEEFKVARDRNPNYGLLENELQDWLFSCAADKVLVTDDMIKAKAISLVEDEGVTEGFGVFKCGRTWLRNFKSRYGIVQGHFGDYSQSVFRLRDRALGYWNPPPTTEIDDMVNGLAEQLPFGVEAVEEATMEEDEASREVVQTTFATSSLRDEPRSPAASVPPMPVDSIASSSERSSDASSSPGAPLRHRVPTDTRPPPPGRPTSVVEYRAIVVAAENFLTSGWPTWSTGALSSPTAAS